MKASLIETEEILKEVIRVEDPRLKEAPMGQPSYSVETT
jgi:hypothetical protein